jgi:hypothetical protein
VEVSLLEKPQESLAGVVVWGTVLFYWAEKDENDKVNDIWDAFHYVTTALSVGYANLFPVTAAGKLIGGILMSIGPSLAAHGLDPPLPALDAALSLGAKLDEILVELRKISAAAQAS